MSSAGVPDDIEISTWLTWDLYRSQDEMLALSRPKQGRTCRERAGGNWLQ
jgi:hypothetical protein